MGVRKYKPTSPGRRQGMVSDFADITKKKPEKALLTPLRSAYGRNSHGRITSRYRWRGAKKLYRVVDFKRKKDDIPARVVAIEYDPNRTARIALLQYADGEKRYILAPREIKVGDEVISGEKVEPKPGNCMPMASIPLGLPIHNIELAPGRGGQIAKSAGAVAQLSAREGKYAVVVLPSGEIRKILVRCRATIGQLSHVDHMNITIGKAGRSYYLGRKGHVRGICRNPVDHPMGGGEGRSKSGAIPRSPWGTLAKGGKTRNPRSASSRLIIRRRKKKRK